MVIKSESHTLYSAKPKRKQAWIDAIFVNLGALARYAPTTDPPQSGVHNRASLGARWRMEVSYRKFMKRAANGDCDAINRLRDGMSDRALGMKLRRVLAQLESQEDNILTLDRGKFGHDKQIKYIKVNWKIRIRSVHSYAGMYSLNELRQLSSKLLYADDYVASLIGVETSTVQRWLSGRQSPTYANVVNIHAANQFLIVLAAENGQRHLLSDFGEVILKSAERQFA